MQTVKFPSSGETKERRTNHFFSGMGEGVSREDVDAVSGEGGEGVSLDRSSRSDTLDELVLNTVGSPSLMARELNSVCLISFIAFRMSEERCTVSGRDWI